MIGDESEQGRARLGHVFEQFVLALASCRVLGIAVGRANLLVDGDVGRGLGADGKGTGDLLTWLVAVWREDELRARGKEQPILENLQVDDARPHVSPLILEFDPSAESRRRAGRNEL